MLFTFLMGILLLVTVGGVFRPSVQALLHGFLTACCLLAGNAEALNLEVALCCMILMCVTGVIACFLLKGQVAYRSLKMLFTSLLLVILAVSLIIYVLPPSLFRLEYGVAFSVILIGMLYSVLSDTLGGQVIGMICVLDALTLLVGLNGHFLAFVTLIVFYGLFLMVVGFMLEKQGYVEQW